MNNETKYQELTAKFGPRTAEMQRRFDYRKEHEGLVDLKFFIDDDAIATAKANGATTNELVESCADELLRMMDAKPLPHDKDFF